MLQRLAPSRPRRKNCRNVIRFDAKSIDVAAFLLHVAALWLRLWRASRESAATSSVDEARSLETSAALPVLPQSCVELRRFERPCGKIPRGRDRSRRKRRSLDRFRSEWRASCDRMIRSYSILLGDACLQRAMRRFLGRTGRPQRTLRRCSWRTGRFRVTLRHSSAEPESRARLRRDVRKNCRRVAEIAATSPGGIAVTGETARRPTRRGTLREPTLDLFWRRDESLEDSASLPDPHVLAAEAADDGPDGPVCTTMPARESGR